MRCCICGKEFEGFGNNPAPVFMENADARCCDECNTNIVIPTRMTRIMLMRAANDPDVLEEIAELIAIIEVAAEDEGYVERSGDDGSDDAEEVAGTMGQDSDAR